MRFFEPRKQDVTAFMKKRLSIQQIYFIATIIAYMMTYLVFHPADTPILSVWISLLLTPVFMFAFYFRTMSFLYVRNQYYIAYLIASTITYLYTMTLFDVPYNKRFVTYEITHTLLSAVVGYGSAILVSVPFKLVHMILFDSVFYYTKNDLLYLEKSAFPDKMKKEVEKKKEEFKFDNLNETQLNAELNLAVREERFEDATVIRKILKQKFS